MNYEELVKALRDIEKTMFALGTSPINMGDVSISLAYDKRWGQTAEAAAAAIEALQAEVEELKAKKMKLAENSLRFVGKVRELDKRRFEPKRGEIVRCRECRWGHLCVMGQHLGLDGFCSKGEREVQE